MDGLTTCCIGRFFLPSSRRKHLSPRPGLVVFASRDDSSLDRWDQMELKFGRLIGEDPKLTLAKIMGRKSNPDASYLEIEKSFRKKKGSSRDEEIFNSPGVSKEDQDYSSLRIQSTSSKISPQGKNLNIVRPLMKGMNRIEGVKDESLNTIRENMKETPQKLEKNSSNVTLRKPIIMSDDDMDKSAKLKIKPNLVLKMRTGSIEDYSEIPLLKKPEPVIISSSTTQQDVPSNDNKESNSDENEVPSCLEQNSADLISETISEQNSDGFLSSKVEYELKIGLQPPNHIDEGSLKKQVTSNDSLESNSTFLQKDDSLDAALLGKPLRSKASGNDVEDVAEQEDSRDENNKDIEIEQFLSTALDEQEDGDWTRAVNLLQSGGWEDVELISCSSRGFVVSLGSLIGFLPYRNLGAKWKFLAFESWLRKKGLDPNLYKQNLNIIGNHEFQTKNVASTKSEADCKPTTGGNLEDLLEDYDKEKTDFLSSFVGQRIKVNVILADRNSRRLMFSGRPREKEVQAEKKRNLMKRLSVGDVVQCCIKKITYFGIFVEVEGVAALIHQSEVSWDATLDPSSYYKLGQIVEAKVHQLDFALERISLSLKQITIRLLNIAACCQPDPLMETLESVVGDTSSFDRNAEFVQANSEWSDVEALIKELHQIEGVFSVSKGRFFLSPGLAPTFQVYMASVFDNQYKLLARSGNKVQEVIVQASLDKEQMKDAILTCTNRVQ